MQKVLLLVLDGWGIKNSRTNNAIKLAKTPNLDKLCKKNPHSVLKAAGKAVGLPEGYMGNSEVGHLTLGAGRVVDGDLRRINKSIKNGFFLKNKVLLKCLKSAKNHVEKVHLMGLLSDAGVHSHIKHLFALLKLCKRIGVKEVYIHAFLDGRDTPPKSAIKYVKLLQNEMKRLGIGQLASMMGRYYAMDRDNRWNREHKAYDAMVNCIGRKENDAVKALKNAYARGETDEFIKPILLLDKCVVDKNDSVIFFNFRSDRARELTRAFVWGMFKDFKRKKIIGLKFVSLTQYDSLVKVPVAFKPEIPKHTLGEVISKKGLKQLRIAETEKWAHVTYFFNGLCECVFPNEKRIHVSSRKVSTYDKTPRMKVKEITNKFLLNKNKFDFFVVNFANADMVGHTGNFKKCVKAVEAVDKQIGRIIKAFKGVILITADHGNCEDMSDDCSTCHTNNKVPLIGVNLDGKLKDGGLSDVAPTILSIMGIKKPNAMSGKSLIYK
jgi:2,3-bisphosphoglycerate-independent phosphoglycerate mutase